MLIKLRPEKNYFDLTHDLFEKGVYNDPDIRRTWSWQGTSKKSRGKTCSINGSPYLSAKGVGRIIQHLVAIAREGKLETYSYLNLMEAMDATEV